MKQSLYNTFVERINTQIANGLEKDGLQWFATWSPNFECINGASNAHYRGVNHLNLSLNGFADTRYFTRKQAEGKGYKVQDGAKAQGIIKFAYWDKEKGCYLSREEYDNSNPNHSQFMKLYYVYNAEQLEGIELQQVAKSKFNLKLIENIASAMGVEVVKGSHNKFPCYKPSEDKVYIPTPSLFKSQKGLLATSLHELAHASGHSTRLNREFGKSKTSKEYAFEELVAEMSSAILCGYFGIENQVDDNHVAYIKSWFAQLKNDKKLFANAFKQAETVADYVIAMSKGEEYEFETQPAKVEIVVEKPKKVQPKVETKSQPKVEKTEGIPQQTYFDLLVSGGKAKTQCRGYIQEYKGHQIGISYKRKMGGKLVQDKNNGKITWTISDIATGVMFGRANTMKEVASVLAKIEDKIDEFYASKDYKQKVKALQQAPIFE